MKALSPLELAFLGDAIHTMYVREFVLSNFDKTINSLHLLSSKFCRASHQSEVLDRLKLTEEEAEVVRKARNAKPKHHAKNAQPAEYKKATSFEALVGHLYVSGKTERLQEILTESVK